VDLGEIKRNVAEFVARERSKRSSPESTYKVKRLFWGTKEGDLSSREEEADEQGNKTSQIALT